ncbi:MAG: hypothetical protein AB8B83_05195 [Bdellovibrionales bacterium]
MNKTNNNSSYGEVRVNPCFGVQKGASKLSLAYRAGSLVMWSRYGHVSDEAIDKISHLVRRVDRLDQRSASLTNKFRRIAENTVSFTVENSVILGAASVTGFINPAAGIASASAATYPQSLGAWFLKNLKDAGYDVKDSEQLKAALGDKDFMKKAKLSSHVHAAQMSGAVLGAGLLAGYIYSALAKPVSGLGASFARSVLPRVIGERLLGEFAEKGAMFFGDALAKGVKSGANSLGRKALASGRVKPIFSSLFLTAALASSSALAQSDAATQDKIAVEREEVRKLPHYNTSSMYL